MISLWIVIGAVVAVVSWIVWHASSRARRRRNLRGMRLDDRERAWLEGVLPLWKRLPEDIRGDAEGWMHVFLDEKNFEACGGLEEVTREMRLAVAAPACLLIARRPHAYYERLRSILIYPGAYRDPGGRWHEEDVRLGESWDTGSVVLSWEGVLQGDRDPDDGLNVVLHEFAHQLDQEDGVADGVPEFDEPDDFGRWSGALVPAYEDFLDRLDEGRRTVMDPYAAENPAEFFAVATETFFERAPALKREEPEVYAELSRFYGMDPATW